MRRKGEAEAEAEARRAIVHVSRASSWQRQRGSLHLVRTGHCKPHHGRAQPIIYAFCTCIQLLVLRVSSSSLYNYSPCSHTGHARRTTRPCPKIYFGARVAARLSPPSSASDSAVAMPRPVAERRLTGTDMHIDIPAQFFTLLLWTGCA